MRKLIGVAVLLLLGSFLFAEIDYLPVNQVKPGMRGYLKTVFDGTTDVRVEFEVKLVRNEQVNGQQMPIVWVWAQTQPGQPVPAAGQSGSPCWLYTDQGEKFLGLLSLGLNIFDKSPVFGITPYEYIAKNSNSQQTNPETLRQDFNHLSLPLNLDSLDRGLSDLNQIFPESRFKFISPDLGQNNLDQPLEIKSDAGVPVGLPVNIYLTRGDLSLYAHGNCIIDGDQIVGLGHPFLGLGDTDLPVYPAFVGATIENYLMSYRLPGPDIGPLLGTITTDTHWGVKGQIGRQPKMIPVNFAFQNQNFSQQRNFEVVRIKITPQLLSAIINYYLLNIGIEAGINGVNRGALSIETTYLFKNKTPYIQTQIYNFENNYFQVVYQYANFLEKKILLPIFGNPEFLTDLEQISFDVKVNPNFQKLILEKIKVKGKIGSKKKIKVELSLLSLDEKTGYKTELEIVCPVGIKKGEGQIEVRTGMYYPNPASSYKTVDEYLRVQTNITVFVKAVFYLEKKDGQNLLRQEVRKVNVEKEGLDSTTIVGSISQTWLIEKLFTGEKIEILFELRPPVKADVTVNYVFTPDPQTGGFDYER